MADIIQLLPDSIANQIAAGGKKVKLCDSETIASLAGGNNGLGSALIIAKFPKLLFYIKQAEELDTCRLERDSK